MKKAKYTFKVKKDFEYLKKRKNFLNSNFNRNVDYVADGFPKYARRQEVTRFLARIELFKKISEIQGSIVECGVYSGNGLFTGLYYPAFMNPSVGV